MKKFFMILILYSPVLALASENCSTTSGEEAVQEQLEIKTDVPSHLKGATIIVRLADGRETTVPAEQFKVVPRQQQFIVTKTKQLDKTVCSAEVNKNRVSLLGGNGPKEGLTRTVDGNTVTVESKTGVVSGLQYQRLITDRISVGGQIQSNESALINVGLDF